MIGQIAVQASTESSFGKRKRKLNVCAFGDVHHFVLYRLKDKLLQLLPLANVLTVIYYATYCFLARSEETHINNACTLQKERQYLKYFKSALKSF